MHADNEICQKNKSQWIKQIKQYKSKWKLKSKTTLSLKTEKYAGITEDKEINIL